MRTAARAGNCRARRPGAWLMPVRCQRGRGSRRAPAHSRYPAAPGTDVRGHGLRRVCDEYGPISGPAGNGWYHGNPAVQDRVFRARTASRSANGHVPSYRFGPADPVPSTMRWRVCHPAASRDLRRRPGRSALPIGDRSRCLRRLPQLAGHAGVQRRQCTRQPSACTGATSSPTGKTRSRGPGSGPTPSASTFRATRPSRRLPHRHRSEIPLPPRSHVAHGRRFDLHMLRRTRAAPGFGAYPGRRRGGPWPALLVLGNVNTSSAGSM